MRNSRVFNKKQESFDVKQTSHEFS